MSYPNGTPMGAWEFAEHLTGIPVETLRRLSGIEPSMLAVPKPLDWAYTPNGDNAVTVYFETTEQAEEFIGAVRNSMIGDAT